MGKIIVGVAGGTGSGKTTFVNQLVQHFSEENINVVPQDAYYHDNSNISQEQRNLKNYDHPDAIDWELLAKHVQSLQRGESIYRPVYSMLTCTRQNETVFINAGNILIVEGILIFTQPAIRELLDLKIFIDADMPERFQRILKRDKTERGRNDAQVAERFYQTVQPMHTQFIEPAKQFADVIVSNGGLNLEAVNSVVQLINEKLFST